eukprot:5650003-Pleurochrysis_carterae.AAC.1
MEVLEALSYLWSTPNEALLALAMPGLIVACTLLFRASFVQAHFTVQHSKSTNVPEHASTQQAQSHHLPSLRQRAGHLN